MNRSTWADRIGVTLVDIAPHGATLPVRALYDPAGTTHGIGVNPFEYAGSCWYALPDVLAARLLDDTCPIEVLRAVRLVGHGRQPTLEPIKLRGGQTINPRREDPFIHLIEERHRVLRDPSRSEQERDRLEKFLKITANATAYGILARFDRKSLAQPAHLVIYGPDPGGHAARSNHPEDPGPLCFPPIAASITAAARLRLALLERLIRDAGGCYAFCDTDSLAIVTTTDGSALPCTTADGATIPSLTPAAVDAIRGRFAGLSPFDPDLVPDAWKVEHNSLDAPVNALVLSAKRYALYRLANGKDPDVLAIVDRAERDDTADDMVDWSEHGLGLHMDPLADKHGTPRRDDAGRLVWIRDAWEWLIRRAHGQDPPLPAWAAQPALTRFSLSSPHIATWVAGYNKQHPGREIRPGSFGLLAHPDILLDKGTKTDGKPLARPAAAYEPNPAAWDDIRWYDRATGDPVMVTRASPADMGDRDLLQMLEGRLARIRTLGDVLHLYETRAEHKSLAPDGSPATGTTQGQLRRRPIVSAPVLTELTGKEANHLADRSLDDSPGRGRASYGRRAGQWRHLEAPVLRLLGPTEITRRTGLDRRTIQRALHPDGATPHPRNRRRLRATATEYARALLAAAAQPVPSDGDAALYAVTRSEIKHRSL
jgi:hypothetical protein